MVISPAMLGSTSSVNTLEPFLPLLSVSHLHRPMDDGRVS